MIERRQFLKTLGVGGSAAVLQHCAPPPAEQLIPYLVPPDDVVPGVAAYYATTCRECPAGCGMLAKTREGRVIKVEGNPAHPIGSGALCVRGQAAVQSLYNPDRFKGPLARDARGRFHPISWDDAEGLLASKLREVSQRGGGPRIAWIGRLLTGSLERLTGEWLAALGSHRRLFYETFDYAPLRAASEMAFGRREIPVYHFDRARLVLSFGADFLETWLSNVEFAAAFSEVRRARIADEFGSFVYVGPRLSMTGSNADAWLPVPPGAESALALSLVHSMVEQGLTDPSAATHLPWVRTLVGPFAPDATQRITEVPPSAVAELARRLAAAAPSLAVGGGVAAEDDKAVELELAVLLLNAMAGNIGRTIAFGGAMALDGLAPYEDLRALSADMAAGKIEVLFVHHANPVFTLPPASGFADAVEHVPFVVSFSSMPDETTAKAHLVLPDHHFLESWGDYAPRAGVLGVQQPAMRSLSNTRATGDVLLRVWQQLTPARPATVEQPDYAFWVQSHWESSVRMPLAADSTWNQFWPDVLRRGGHFSDAEPAAVTLRDVSNVFQPPRESRPRRSDEYALVVYPSPHFFDGRNANDPWLQEIPDPVTKLVWSGWVEIHPETARRRGIAEGDLVEVQSPHGRVSAVAHLYDRLRPDIVAMPLGYGRAGPLRYAANRGANPIALLAPEPVSRAGSVAWRSVQVTLSRKQGKRMLVMLQATQGAPAEPSRPATARVVRPDRIGTAHQSSQSVDFYPRHIHPEHRWGMAIDLNTCTGCNACVAACYAENNVPVVGETMCAQGREMSWIRIQRYEHDAADLHGLRSPGVVNLPMLCQHCDEAPCEAVCPVYATYHNPEGLNAQVYVRCIGTRYCSNNCPYKVRRFNFATLSWVQPLDLQLNPDVTVRTSGVMEKCTFCIQRINAAKNDAAREQRRLRDGDVIPACAQTCPAQAIVFGDLKDPDSRVSRLARDPRGYHVLDELNTRPAITYLKRVAPGAPVSLE